MLAVYREQQPDWCPKKQSIAAMATIADNVTAQILSALKEQEMWCENDFLAPPFPSVETIICQDRLGINICLVGNMEKLWPYLQGIDSPRLQL